MKDAKGHGSDGRGGGDNTRVVRASNGEVARLPRSGSDEQPVTFGRALGDQLRSKFQPADSEAGFTAKFGPGIAHQMVLAGQHGVPTDHLDSSKVNSSGHAWGSPEALNDFKREHGGPANKGQLARIARFHKAVGRGS